MSILGMDIQAETIAIISTLVTGVLGIITMLVENRRKKNQERHEREMADKSARLESLESQQIQIQTEADKSRAQMDVFKDLIADIPRSRETLQQQSAQWQNTIDTMATMNHERAQRVFDLQEKTNTALDAMTTSIGNLSNVLEIQSVQFKAMIDKNNETQRMVQELHTQQSQFKDFLEDTRKQNRDDMALLISAVKDLSNTVRIMETNLSRKLESMSTDIQDKMSEEHAQVFNQIQTVKDIAEQVKAMEGKIIDLQSNTTIEDDEKPAA